MVKEEKKEVDTHETITKARPTGIIFPPRLIAQLKQIRHYPLTVLEAPSGFGKTTTLDHLLKTPSFSGCRIFRRTVTEAGQTALWDTFCKMLSRLDALCTDALRQKGIPEPETLDLQLLCYTRNGRFEPGILNHLIETAFFARLSPEQKQFCLALSVFQSFTVPQASFVTGEPAERVKSQLNLQGFICREENVYRFHSLFSAYLSAVLSERPKEEQNRLYEKGGDWAKLRKPGAEKRNSGQIRALSSFLKYNQIDEMNKHHRKAYELLGHKASLINLRSTWTFGSPSVLLLYHRSAGKLSEECVQMDECMPVYYALTGGHGMGAEYMMRAEADFMRGHFDRAEEAAKYLQLALDSALPDQIYMPFAQSYAELKDILPPDAAPETVRLGKEFTKNTAMMKSGKNQLSPREREVASLIRMGLTNKQIAARLYISISTVKLTISNIFEKTGIKSRVQLSDAELTD